MRSEKKRGVIFSESKREKEFEALKGGKFEDKELYDAIQKAISQMKLNPTYGTKIARRLWPREYILRYQITNLWKFDLPSGWRLIYTIKEDDVMILNIILNWFRHKEYE